MPRRQEPPLRRHLLEAAVEAARPHYRRAIACLIEGHATTGHWDQFIRILGRSYVLEALNGMSAAAAQARHCGVETCPPEQFRRRRWWQFQRETADFDVGPFAEAIAAFEGRVPRLRSTVGRLIREGEALAQRIAEAEQAGAVADLASRASVVQRVASQSFFVTGADRATIIDLRSIVADAIRGELQEGELVSLPDFIDRAQLRGAVGLTDARLEVIYRNNLNSAYNDGQAAILAEPEVRVAIPLMELDEIKDRRTRGNPNGLYPDRGFHWQMDGFVGTVDDFSRFGIRPPNGHNCRGGVRGVPFAEAIRRGFVDDSGALDLDAIAAHNGDRIGYIERGEYPDPGFLSV